MVFGGLVFYVLHFNFRFGKLSEVIMENKISFVDKVELVSLKERLNDLNYFVVTVPGKKVRTFRQYLNFMGKKFKMPDYAGFAAYSDWMTDLSWIPNQKIAVIINKYDFFMNKNPKLKRLIMDPKLQEQISHTINPIKSVFSLIFIFYGFNLTGGSSGEKLFGCLIASLPAR